MFDINLVQLIQVGNINNIVLYNIQGQNFSGNSIYIRIYI